MAAKTHADNVDNKHACDPCRFDEEAEVAVGFCVECVEYICKDCLKHHRKNKATRNHNILKDGNIPTSTKSFKLLRDAVACPNHPESEVEYKCNDHDQYICVVCVGRNHRKCERIEEIADALVESSDKENGNLNLEKIQMLTKRTLSLRIEEENNIESLLQESKNVARERENYIGQVLEKLTQLQKHSTEDIDKYVQQGVIKLREDLTKTVVKEREQLEYVNLLETTLECGSLKQINVVLNRISKKVQHIQDDVEELSGHSDLAVTFKPNVDLLGISNIGTVESTEIKPFENGICYVSSSRTEKDSTFEVPVANESIPGKTKLSTTLNRHSMDNNNTGDVKTKMPNTTAHKAEQYTNTSKKHDTETIDKEIKGKEQNSTKTQTPMRKREIRSVFSSYSITDKDDKEKCSIYGCVILPDGLFVFIDNSNRKIKVYNERFIFINAFKLTQAPSSICPMLDDSIAITYTVWKRISRFIVREGCIESDGGFTTDLFCRSLTKYGEHLAVLCADKDGNTQVTSRDDIIAIQISEIKSGMIIKTIQTFRNRDLNVYVNNPYFLMCRDNGKELLIGEEWRLLSFDGNGKLRWNYRGFKGDKYLEYIAGATTDNEGNMFICGSRSNNVHQVWAYNFKDSRVVIPRIKNPCCIEYDARKGRLVIGCEKDNFVHVYRVDTFV